jgi:hypothetical protein
MWKGQIWATDAVGYKEPRGLARNPAYANYRKDNERQTQEVAEAHAGGTCVHVHMEGTFLYK